MSGVERITLGTFPTPLHELKNLSNSLGGPSIYIKRDDLTGLALGGNKVRKLEYILADALHQGAQVIITTGAVTSNHARQTAAAAAVLGLECHLVLAGSEPGEKQGNYLLDYLFGARVSIVGWDGIENEIVAVADNYASQGKKPYVIPAGGSTMLGIMAYRDAYREIREQAPHQFDAIITAVGTGSTLAGLHVGIKQAGDSTSAVGISVGLGDSSFCQREVARLSNSLEKDLGLPLSSDREFKVLDNYAGPGYGAPYPKVRETIIKLACSEGILLDPVYSAKAMVGLLDLVEQGCFSKGHSILFLHTGGAPEVFSMNRYLSGE